MKQKKDLQKYESGLGHKTIPIALKISTITVESTLQNLRAYCTAAILPRCGHLPKLTGTEVIYQ